MTSRDIFRNAKKLFIPENNSNTSHSRMAGYVGDLHLMNLWRESGKIGTRKDEMTTEDYVRTTRILLQDKKIFFDSKWFTQDKATKAGTPKIITELMEQLMRFGYNKFGKLTGKHGGQKDDLAIAWLMQCYFQIIANSGYRKIELQ